MSFVERAIKKLQEARVSDAPLPSRSSVRPEDGRGRATPSDSGVQRPAASRAAVNAAAAQLRDADRRRIEISRTTLRAEGLLPPEHQERDIADDYRQIKRPLLARALGLPHAPEVSNARCIMVASALSGEGKTFTSVNLAMSIARERELRVVLVDADVAKPHITRSFGLASEKGLLDLLTDESLEIEDLILATDIPSLYILPSGRQSETATELLASARMTEIMATMAANDPTRIVVLDSPPLLLTSESRVLGSIAGQIVLVVRAGATPQQAVLDAINYLGEHDSVEMILNQSEASLSHGFYYGQVPYGAVESEE
jgi:protein-tyrosine kinase